MENKGLEEPIPIRKKSLVWLRGLGSPFAKANSTVDLTCSKLSNQLSPDFKKSLLRARSATPTTQKLFNGMNTEEILKQRLNFYNLNHVVDTTEHKKYIYNKSSQWFSRDVKPELPIQVLFTIPDGNSFRTSKVSLSCYGQFVNCEQLLRYSRVDLHIE